MHADSVNITIKTRLLPEDTSDKNEFDIARKIMKRFGFVNNKKYAYFVTQVGMECGYDFSESYVQDGIVVSMPGSSYISLNIVRNTRR